MPTQAQAQERALRALVSLVDDLAVDQEPEALLRSTLEHVIEALELTGGITFVLEADHELTAAAESGLPSIDPAALLRVAREALACGAPVVREDAAGALLLATVLRSRQRVLGVLALHDPNAVVRDLPLLEALGKQLGTGLENARLYAEVRAASRDAEVRNRIMATLTSGLELKTVVPAFAEEAAALLPFDRMICGFVNDSGDYIEIVGYPEAATWGLGNVLPVVGSGPGSVVLNSTPILQSDLLHSHRFIEDMRLLEEGLRSYILLPLHCRGRCIGVLGFGSREGGSYDQATLERMLRLMDAVAVALDNVRLFQKTRELSITDEVTPLFNVRFFHQILDRELKLVDRYRSVLSVVFVDLDRFKPINDRYGHLRGSRVLREVGFLLRAAVRETDYPARYGGDEFVVILPQTDAEAAHALAEKLRRLVEGHTFLQEEGINARIGMSMGIATYPTEVSTKEGLIRLADERMYADKGERKGE